MISKDEAVDLAVQKMHAGEGETQADDAALQSGQSDLYVWIDGRLLASASVLRSELARVPDPTVTKPRQNITLRKITGTLVGRDIATDVGLLEVACAERRKVRVQSWMAWSIGSAMSAGTIERVTVTWTHETGSICEFEFVGEGKPTS